VKLYPLVFSFRDIIAGNGFVAIVAMDGRVVLAEEGAQDIWMFGVQPGGIAGGERQQALAFAEFKKSYLSVLFDVAAEALSFDEFKGKVTAFFSEINEPNLADWNRARAEVKNGTLSRADLAQVDADERSPSLTIEEMAPAKTSSTVNEFDQIAEAA